MVQDNLSYLSKVIQNLEKEAVYGVKADQRSH